MCCEYVCEGEFAWGCALVYVCVRERESVCRDYSCVRVLVRVRMWVVGAFRLGICFWH